jgi:hypothetical protein
MERVRFSIFPFRRRRRRRRTGRIEEDSPEEGAAAAHRMLLLLLHGPHVTFFRSNRPEGQSKINSRKCLFF